MEVPFDEPRAPRRLLFDDLVLEMQSSRICLRVCADNDEQLLRARTCAIRILTDLPHTPVTGVGINFSFIDTQPSAGLLARFNLADNGALAEQEWIVSTSTLHRELKKAGAILNLSMNLDNAGRVKFDLNYHTTPANAQAAREALELDIVARKNESTQLINQVYYTEAQ